MTHPLDLFRSDAEIESICDGLFPGGGEESSACVASRQAEAKAEFFGILIGGAVGILAGYVLFRKMKG